MKRFVVAILLVFAPVWCVAAKAPQASATSQVDAYSALVDSLTPAAAQERVMDGVMASVRTQYAAIPELAALEQRHPGFLDAAVTAMRPVFAARSARLFAQYRPQMVDILRGELTEAEARELTDFYNSSVGQAILGNASRNLRADNTLSSAFTDNNVSAEDVAKDAEQAGTLAIAQLTPEQRMAVVRQATTSTAYAKMKSIAPRVFALRAKMELEPLTKEEEEGLTAAIKGVVAKYRE